MPVREVYGRIKEWGERLGTLHFLDELTVVKLLATLVLKHLVGDLDELRVKLVAAGADSVVRSL